MGGTTESLGLSSDRPEEAPDYPTESQTGLGLRTDEAIFLVVDIPTGSQDASWD